MPTDRNLVDAVKRAVAGAWQAVRREHPSEFLYAVGALGMVEGDYFVPFVYGEQGLTRVAEQYVKRGTYPTVEAARGRLRWSTGDAASPYSGIAESFVDRIDEALKARPNVDDYWNEEANEFDEAKVKREVRTRLDSMVAALKELDAEGVFNDDGRRNERVVLLEAGDWTPEFMLGYAKKLNPPAVFAAFKKQFETPSWGRYVEMGTKKVHVTESVALTGPDAPGGRRLYAGANQLAFAFDVASRRQLWHSPIRFEKRTHGVTSIATPRDGSFVAALSTTYERLLLIWSDPAKPKSLTVHRLPGTPTAWSVLPWAIAVDPNGQFVVVAGAAGEIFLYRPDGEAIVTLGCDKHDAYTVHVSPDGKTIVAGLHAAGVWTWRSEGGEWRRGLRIDAPADQVRFSPDGRRIITALHRGRGLDFDDELRFALSLWDVDSGQRLHDYRVEGYSLQAPSFDATGRRIACCAQEAYKQERTSPSATEAFVFDTQSGGVLERLRLPVCVGGFNQIEFIDDASLAIAAFGNKNLRPVLIWELENREQ